MEEFWGTERTSIALKTLLTQMQMLGISLVVQWLRLQLPVQGTRVQFLVREPGHTCCVAWSKKKRI